MTDDRPTTREIRLEVEVPGTPEQVWEAIATGPGISTWFVPAEVEPREGGRIVMRDLAPGTDETGVVTAYDAPHRFAYEAPAEGEHRLAYEWLVEARGGGSCVVRLVNSGFSADAAWDAEYDGMTEGWKLFLANLRLALTHFPGRRAHPLIVGAVVPRDPAATWIEVRAALGLSDAAVGEHVRATADGAPPLAGVVERATDAMVTLRLDAPTDGIAFLAAEGSPDATMLSLYGFLFGDDAEAVAVREKGRWQRWLDARFPLPAEAPTG